MSSQVPWPEMERHLRGHLYAVIDHTPELLLDADGGPVGATADIILARLLGFDDEIVDDSLRLGRVEQVWLKAIPQQFSVTAVELTADIEPLRTAEYVLQSCYAQMAVASMLLPPEMRGDSPTFQTSVLAVRYRRRS